MSMPMLAGVGLLVVCCSSASVAAFMMGGDDDDDKKKTQLGPTGPSAVIKKYRYVRIYREMPTVLHAGGHFMNLAEVEVFSGGVNVAAGKTVTGSSLHTTLNPHSFLVDGIMDNFAHTNNGPVEWFLIDLGEEYEIDSVAVTNRATSRPRMENTKIQLSKTSDMTTSEDSRVITKEEAPSASFTWTVASDTIVVA